MRIVENSATRLCLRDRTLWISLVCFAAAGLLFARFFGEDWTPLVGAGLFAACGLAFLRFTDVVFDRYTHRCSLTRLDVLRLTRREFAFTEIKDVAVETEPLSSDRQAIPCRLSLVTGSETIPLTASYEPDLKRFEAMRAEILDWLFKDRAKPAATDPVAALAKAGRTIDAIRLLREREGLDLTAAKERVEKMRDE